MKSPNQLQSLLSQVDQLKQNDTSFLLAKCFPEQRNFLLDKARFKAALCTRRAAKSYSCTLKLFMTCLNNPNTKSLFLAKTRASAKNIIWKDCVAAIKRDYNIDCELKESVLEVHFPNGAEFKLLGVDKDDAEMTKLLGGKYKLVVIDEGSEYRIDIHTLVYKMLRPAVADLDGEIIIVGTPSDYLKGLFYDLTYDSQRVPERMGWSIHSWDTTANPYMRRQWLEDIEDLRKNNPKILQTPGYKQHYQKTWVADTDNMVYKYGTANKVGEAEIGKHSKILGIDLGYNDETSFVLSQYYHHVKKMTFTKAEKHSKWTLRKVTKRLNELYKQHNPDRIVIDGANRQFVESIIEETGLHIEIADKTDKFNWIKKMNSDFICGRIEVVEGECDALIAEWEGLLKRIKPNGQPEEDPKCPNHLTDAALYSWRLCTHAFSEPEPDDKLTKFEKEELRMIEECERGMDDEDDLLNIFDGVDDY